MKDAIEDRVVPAELAALYSPIAISADFFVYVHLKFYSLETLNQYFLLFVGLLTQNVDLQLLRV